MDASVSGPDERGEPGIVMLGIERDRYFLFKGEEHLNQILLVDGDFPKPILCLHFDDAFHANLFIGSDQSLGSFWAVHPEIVARLRADDHLVETDG